MPGSLAAAVGQDGYGSGLSKAQPRIAFSNRFSNLIAALRTEADAPPPRSLIA